MSPEPQEMQILKQLLGNDLGAMVFGLNTLAGSCAQLGQEVQRLTEQMQQMQAAQQPIETPPAPSENPWTGPDPTPREGS